MFSLKGGLRAMTLKENPLRGLATKKTKPKKITFPICSDKQIVSLKSFLNGFTKPERRNAVTEQTRKVQFHSLENAGWYLGVGIYR